MMSAIVPRTLRRRLRDLHRERVFRSGMRALVRNPALVAKRPGSVLSDLMYGWGNEGWAAKAEFLQACMQAVLCSRLPVLECGAGLSSIVLGAVAQYANLRLWSLEHIPEWEQRVRQELDAYQISAARIVLAPLRDFGDYDWYDALESELPSQFGFVVCDGPPSNTRGGRVGLVPRMRKRFAPGCVILLDDAERDGEQAIARQWVADLPATIASRGTEKPFFELTLGR